MTGESLKILLLEDSDTDAELAERFLRRAGSPFVLRRVETESDFIRELQSFQPDIILADYTLPEYDCLSALRLAVEQSPDTPFIVVSGSIGDERAVEVLKLGATDYVLKDRMQRLPAAIERAHQGALEAIERRRAEVSLQQEKEFVTGILEAAENLIAVLDSAGEVVRVNNAFEQMMRTRNGESLDKIRILAAEVLAGRLSRQEMILPEDNGSRRLIILWHGSVMRRADGSPEFVVMTGTDLTEMRSLESEIEQSRRVDSLGRMAATVAHEFNNVLMAIRPSVELLRRKPNDPQTVRQSSERIAGAVARGERIAEEVMRFTRPAVPTLQQIEIGRWLAGFSDEIRGFVGERIVLDLIPHTRDLQVFADVRQIAQVFTNLAANARDAMNGAGRLTIAVDELEENGRTLVHITFTDNGGGIRADLLSTIFEPLFTTKRAGTGLGLTVSHQIVTTHGGRIFAESEMERGTTFHILLPELSSLRR
jgi:signal transduction histidine kinase